MRKPPVRLLKTEPAPPARCRNCGREHDATTRAVDAGDDRLDKTRPEPGDVIICLHCGHLMEWTEAGFAELSEEAARAVAGDPRVLALQEARGFVSDALEGEEKKRDG